MLSSETTVVVTGANGRQGHPFAMRLLGRGIPVRALVTNPDKLTAKRLAAAGADLRVGTLDDADYVRAAVEGAAAVFSVPLAAHAHGGRALIDYNAILVEAARSAGVATFVQTTVASLPNHVDYGGSMDWGNYAESRLQIEDAVKNSGIPNWTILQPAYFMENFLPYTAQTMYPLLYSQHRIDWPVNQAAPIALIAAADIGAYALAAMDDPARFHAQSIALGGEALTLAEIAAVLFDVTGTVVTSETLSPADAVAAGYSKSYVALHEWISDRGYQTPSSAELAAKWGITPTTFTDWARAHRDSIPL